MKTKSKPSLYRGDYYTIEEYEDLSNLLNNNLLSRVLRHEIIKYRRSEGADRIKITIRNCHPSLDAYNLIYNTPLDDIPLFLNENNSLTPICQWRFQINK